MIEKSDNESYLHAAAKETVVSWLRDAPEPVPGTKSRFGMVFGPRDPYCLNGVYTEYPLTFEMMRNGRSWEDEHGWWCDCKTRDGYACGCVKPRMCNWPDYDWMNANRHKWEVEQEPNRLDNFGKHFIIPDIAVMDRSTIKYIIEIVHTSSPNLRKLVMVDQAGEAAPQMIFLNASWVMGLREAPDHLQAYFISDMERLAIKSQFGDVSRGLTDFPHGFHTRANDYPIYPLVEQKS